MKSEKFNYLFILILFCIRGSWVQTFLFCFASEAHGYNVQFPYDKSNIIGFIYFLMNKHEPLNFLKIVETIHCKNLHSIYHVVDGQFDIDLNELWSYTNEFAMHLLS